MKKIVIVILLIIIILISVASYYILSLYTYKNYKDVTTNFQIIVIFVTSSIRWHIFDESVLVSALVRNLVNAILFILLYINKITIITPCKRTRIESKSVFYEILWFLLYTWFHPLHLVAHKVFLKATFPATDLSHQEYRLVIYSEFCS